MEDAFYLFDPQPGHQDHKFAFDTMDNKVARTLPSSTCDSSRFWIGEGVGSDFIWTGIRPTRDGGMGLSL